MAGFGNDDGCFIFSLGPKLIVTGRLDDPKRSQVGQRQDLVTHIWRVGRCKGKEETGSCERRVAQLPQPISRGRSPRPILSLLCRVHHHHNSHRRSIYISHLLYDNHIQSICFVMWPKYKHCPRD